VLSATAIRAQQESLFGLRLIVVKTEAEATGLRARLVAGESFEDLAKKYSVDSSTALAGGYLGPVAIGDLRPEVQEALAGLAPRAISPIARVGGEYFLFQLLTEPETRWKVQVDAGARAYQEKQFAKAEQFLAAAVEEAERFGPQDSRLAQSLDHLARLYHDQGKYTEAEALYQRTLAIVEKVRGPEHPDVAASLNNLAWLYQEQAKDAEAEAFYQRALAIREKALGPEHPDVAASLNNLAWLYHDRGKHAEIEPLYRRALAILEKVLGAEHPDVGHSLHNLAGLYSSQGKYAGAEPLYQRSLAILEKTLGPEHSTVADGLEDYAELLRKTGRDNEAAEMEARARAIWAKKH
jgi:tetratricopeptide (TPR) repeat protein